MANKAYQKIYTQLEAITKATVALKAKGAANDELALVHGRLAQVVRIKGDVVTLQVFAGTEGIPTNFSTPMVIRLTAVLKSREKNGRSADLPSIRTNAASPRS